MQLHLIALMILSSSLKGNSSEIKVTIDFRSNFVH